jgi:hypothetical protein
VGTTETNPRYMCSTQRLACCMRPCQAGVRFHAAALRSQQAACLCECATIILCPGACTSRASVTVRASNPPARHASPLSLCTVITRNLTVVNHACSSGPPLHKPQIHPAARVRGPAEAGRVPCARRRRTSGSSTTPSCGCSCCPRTTRRTRWCARKPFCTLPDRAASRLSVGGAAM